jgi:hypothetical protein
VRTVINGRQYETSGRFEVEISADGFQIKPMLGGGHQAMRPVNRCELCHRCDWEPIVYFSVEEAIEAGLLVEVPGPNWGRP